MEVYTAGDDHALLSEGQQCRRSHVRVPNVKQSQTYLTEQSVHRLAAVSSTTINQITQIETKYQHQHLQGTTTDLCSKCQAECKLQSPEMQWYRNTHKCAHTQLSIHINNSTARSQQRNYRHFIYLRHVSTSRGHLHGLLTFGDYYLPVTTTELIQT